MLHETLIGRRRGIARGGRRGAIALALAFTLTLVVFSMLMAFTLDLTADAMRGRNAWAADQALYAAEAGIDVALQTGAVRPVTGECGRGLYAAAVRGERVIALGVVELPSGSLMRRAVEVRRGGDGRAARGSWTQVTPASLPDLAAMVEARRK